MAASPKNSSLIKRTNAIKGPASLDRKSVSTVIAGDLCAKLLVWHNENGLPNTGVPDTIRTLLAAALEAPEMALAALQEARRTAFKHTIGTYKAAVLEAMESVQAQFDEDIRSYEMADIRAATESTMTLGETADEAPWDGN